MGVDIMKGNNGIKCPPIFVAGLLIICLFMSCNWWSLSSENSELIKQLDNLAELLRINGEELGKCTQERLLLDEKLKDSQNKFVQQQIKIEQEKEAQVEVKDIYQKSEAELKECKEKVEENLTLCQVEMESLKKLGESKDKTSETLRTENKSLKSEIGRKDKQINEIEEQLKTLNKTCSLLGKSKFIQSLVKNDNASVKKTGPESGDSGLFSVDNDPREEEMKNALK